MSVKIIRVATLTHFDQDSIFYASLVYQVYQVYNVQIVPLLRTT